jgi:thymidylate synthase
MFRNFFGQTADEAWMAAVDAFRPGAEHDRSDAAAAQSSRAGPTQEILHATISIANPLQRWVISRSPPISPAFGIAEVIWILSGRNDAGFVNYFNRELATYAGHGETYHGAYGHRLRRHLGLDQLERAYRTLARKPESRQVVLQIWDGRCDLPGDDGEPAAEDVPCNVMSMLKVRSGALEWTQILRSNDIFRGVPYNFIQFTTLQEIIAGWLGIAVGSYNHLSDSLHVYDRDVQQIAASAEVVGEPNVDSLALPRRDFDLVIAELMTKAEAVTCEAVSAAQLVLVASGSTLPLAYKNLLCVLCAEGARRRQQPDAAKEIMAGCRNPCFVRLFNRWLSRWVKV